MTGRFLGTVLAMLVGTATLAYNTNVSWRVFMQGLRNQQTPLNYKVFEACESADLLVAADS